MPKNTAPNAHDQIETEHFVVFYEMKYPNCRRAVYDVEDNHPDSRCVIYHADNNPPCRIWLGYNNERIEMQRNKPCFRSYCEELDCYKKEPDCFWNCMRVSFDTIECTEDNESDCGSFPFKCTTYPCLDADQQPRRCISIGSLTPKELIAFKNVADELKNSNNDYGYSLQTHEEISKIPLEEMAKCYLTASQLKVMSVPRRSKDEVHIGVLKRCIGYADGIRAARRSPSSVGDPASGISKSVDDIKVASKRPGAKTKKQRRSKDARRGIIEEALDYKKEHPSMTNDQITDEFGLERGALSKPKVQKLIEQRLLQEQQQREKEDRRQNRTVSQDIGNDLRYEHFDQSRQ